MQRRRRRLVTLAGVAVAAVLCTRAVLGWARSHGDLVAGTLDEHQ